MDLEKLGRKIPQEETKPFLQIINERLNNENRNMFPGYQPVTFMRCHLNELLAQDYLVCEKSDGIRVLYVQFKNEKGIYESFFLDRKLDFYKLELRCPEDAFVILDGELVVDKIDGVDIYHFMICDCIISEKIVVAQRPLIKRLGKADVFIRKYEKMNNFFKISVKKMYKPYGIFEVLSNKETAHETDGLIFTPVNHPYKSGTEPLLFKYKPAKLNSVDFIIKKTGEEWLYKLFCLGNQGDLVFFDYFYDITEEMESLSNNYDGLLGEFSYDSTKWVVDVSDLSIFQGGWVLLKTRTDKTTPNPFSVTWNIVRSIHENITDDFFEEHIKNIRKNWKIRNKEN